LYLAERTLPKKTSSTSSGFRPARSRAAGRKLAWFCEGKPGSSTFDDMRAQLNGSQARKRSGCSCQLELGTGKGKNKLLEASNWGSGSGHNIDWG